MKEEDFMERFLASAATALGVNRSSLDIDLSKDDLQEWDSLGHLKLLLGIEDVFGIKFSFEETSTLTSLRVIFNLVRTRSTKKITHYE